MRQRCCKDIVITAGLIVCGVLAGCSHAPVNESARLEQQASPEAVEIKARLLEASDLAGSAIKVVLEDGQAILSGFVETAEQKEKAGAIALDHDQVNSVENNITVK